MRLHARWIAALLLSLVACTALAQTSAGWQPVNDTIRKSDQDPRNYQAISITD